jgi:type I site-specific restriction-modification system R (restriction) subunit
VFIFDECHRSQFGENNKAIHEFFPNITVTPIVINAFYNRLNGINLIRAHHHQFLLTLHQNTLLKENENIHKVLFVVDRKDLDRQTREEFNKFQENCVEENTCVPSLCWLVAFCSNIGVPVKPKS